MSDWKAAVRRPPQHKVGTGTGMGSGAEAECGLLLKFGLGLGALLIAAFAAMLVFLPNDAACAPHPLNRTYPFTPARSEGNEKIWRIAVVTDLDHGTKSTEKKDTWFSYVRLGELRVNEAEKSASVSWDKDPLTFTSDISAKGRGMELSDLKVFDGHLLSVDDRTGVIYRLCLKTRKAVPWVLLTDGAGNETKGLKGEWMTVKDDELYVGGLGKEWTTTEGVFVNHNPMYIKVVSANGAVRHIRWVDEYISLRRAAGIEYPGYMIHESGQWSPHHRKWIFLPRRASNQVYTEKTDEHAGTNYILTADENWRSVESRRFGPLTQTRGFSAFQFLPGTSDQLILALKSEEDDGKINSFITLLTFQGEVILPETQLEGHFKYEGIEFV